MSLCDPGRTNKKWRWFKRPSDVDCESTNGLAKEIFEARRVQNAYAQIFQFTCRESSKPFFYPRRDPAKPLLDLTSQQHKLAFLVLSPEHFVIQNVIQNGHLPCFLRNQLAEVTQFRQDQKLRQSRFPISASSTPMRPRIRPTAALTSPVSSESQLYYPHSGAFQQPLCVQLTDVNQTVRVVQRRMQLRAHPRRHSPNVHHNLLRKPPELAVHTQAILRPA